MSTYASNNKSTALFIDEAAATISCLAKALTRFGMATLFAGSALVGVTSVVNAQDRSLKLYFTHTGEKATITISVMESSI